MDFLNRRSLLVLIPLSMLVPAWWLLLRPEDAPPAPPTGDPAPASSKGAPARDVADPMLLVRRDPAPVEGAAILKRFREKWRLEEEWRLKLVGEGRDGGCGWQPAGIFARDDASERLELRLFCLGYPENALRWAHDAAFSASTPAWEKRRTVWMLGYLAQVRTEGASRDLATLSQDPDDYLAEVGCWQLSLSPDARDYQPLFKSLANEGCHFAFEALGNWDDPAALEIVRTGLTKWQHQPYPKGCSQLIAKEVLPRLESFAARTWKARAFQAILTEPGPYNRGDIAWALQLVLRHQPSGSRDVLRERLTKIYEQGGACIGSTRPEVHCDAFDSVLLTLARIGGDVLPKERTYLAKHGYGVDPRVRLAEILAGKRYPK